MNAKPYFTDSPLFLVRLWTGRDGDGTDQTQPWGKVLHVVSGEAHTFHNWADLQHLMEAMLARTRTSNRAEPGDPAPYPVPPE